MRLRIIAVAAVVVGAGCSDKREPVAIAYGGTQPQAELAQLDSVVADSMTDSGGPGPVEERRPARSASKSRARTTTVPRAGKRSSDPAGTVAASDTVQAGDPALGSEAVASADTADAVETTEPSNTGSSVGYHATRPHADGRGVVAAGTRIHVAMNDSINSRSDSEGKVVTAKVMEHVTDGAGRVFIRAGSVVQLTVTELEPANSKSADGTLAMRVDGVVAGDEVRPIKAAVQEIPHELRGRGITGSEAAKVGAGTAAGAVAGRVIGGDTRGAVIGGAVGAAAGAAVAVETADRDIVVSSRTPIVLVLSAPLVAARGY